jgi:uncharacterized protein (DUF433 family)
MADRTIVSSARGRRLLSAMEVLFSTDRNGAAMPLGDTITCMQPTAVNHIETTPGVCGGNPWIAGTRIRVEDIVVWHELQGKSPNEIVADFPQLSLADVHAALTYYFDHRDEIRRQMREAREYTAKMKASIRSKLPRPAGE